MVRERALLCITSTRQRESGEKSERSNGGGGRTSERPWMYFTWRSMASVVGDGVRPDEDEEAAAIARAGGDGLGEAAG